MLSQKYRLRDKKEIEKVFQNGRGARGSFLSLKFLPNVLENSRFAIAVSKKVSNKAVERNRIKRQAREIIRLNLEKIKAGMDIAIVCYPSILGKKQDEIKKDILNILKSAGLLNEK